MSLIVPHWLARAERSVRRVLSGEWASVAQAEGLASGQIRSQPVVELRWPFCFSEV